MTYRCPSPRSAPLTTNSSINRICKYFTWVSAVTITLLCGCGVSRPLGKVARAETIGAGQTSHRVSGGASLDGATTTVEGAVTNGDSIPAPRIVATPPPPTQGYHLVFADDFNTPDLSPDGKGDHTWYRGIWHEQPLPSIGNISVSGSILSLKWRRGQIAGDTSISTLSPNTEHFKAWRYGYFEARMRWNVVPGAWPAFWLIPVQRTTGQDIYDGTKEFGEIDIFEGQGVDPHTFYGTIHDWVNDRDHASRPTDFQLPTTVDLSKFHVYGLLWTPGRFTWYLDNVAVGSSMNAPAIFDKQNFFAVLSAQEGVNWTYGNLSGVTSSTMTLDVDWVRVWQK